MAGPAGSPAATAPAAPPAPPPPAPCLPRYLSASVGAGQGTPGSSYVVIDFKNLNNYPCTLYGYPDQTVPIYLHFTSTACAKPVRLLTVNVVVPGLGG